MLHRAPIAERGCETCRNLRIFRVEGKHGVRDEFVAGPIGAVAGGSALQVGDINAPGKNGLGAIQAGTLELSNVDLTDQFANLITTQRSFQAGSRLITVSDSVLEDIVNLKRS